MFHNLGNGDSLGDCLSKRAQSHRVLSLVVELIQDVVNEVSGLNGSVDTDDAIWDSLSLRSNLLVFFQVIHHFRVEY